MFTFAGEKTQLHIMINRTDRRNKKIANADICEQGVRIVEIK